MGETRRGDLVDRAGLRGRGADGSTPRIPEGAKKRIIIIINELNQTSLGSPRVVDEGRVKAAAAAVRGRHALALEQQKLLQFLLAVGRVQLEEHVRVDLAGLERVVVMLVAVPAPVVRGDGLVRVRPRVRLAPTGRVVAAAADAVQLAARQRPRPVRRAAVRRRRLAALLYGAQVERAVHVVARKVRTVVVQVPVEAMEVVLVTVVVVVVHDVRDGDGRPVDAVAVRRDDADRRRTIVTTNCHATDRAVV